jgi:ABC-type multidrug transport system ATPase subunit
VSESWAIETDDLRKSYGATEVLRGLSLRVPRGSIHGFLGRNGAGKTTTIKILLGMAHAAGGSVRVLGLDAGAPQPSVEIRQRTGFVSEDKDLIDYMTVEQIVRFTAHFYPRWRKDLEQDYLRSFELPTDRKVRALSRGMRAKLALMLALCRGVELLILDEPTSGLDPTMIEEVLQAIVTHVSREELTVFFSSHQIAEIEQIADHVAIIDRGRALVDGALDDLRESYCRVELVFAGEAPSPAFKAPGVVSARRKGRVVNVLVATGREQLLEEARALGPVSVDVTPMSLKEIFLESVT